MVHTELFARLMLEVEDLHALAVEGRSPDLPRDGAHVFLGQFCNGLQRVAMIVAQIDNMLADPS